MRTSPCLGLLPAPTRLQRLLHNAEFEQNLIEAEGAALHKRLTRYRTTTDQSDVETIVVVGDPAQSIVEQGASLPPRSRGCHHRSERRPSSDRPTAVFAANDLNALGMISEFNRLGIGVPSEISVVGYDDTSYVGHGAQGLTTIHQPVHEMGSRAAELLVERIECGRTTTAHEVLPPMLVVRGTTAPVVH